MIKLTLNSDTGSKVCLLDKKFIVIGHADADQVDIPLPLPRIQARHVTIEEQNDRFIVCNTANDPFTSLNGMPFGKKPLKNFDQIEIDSYKIQFEFVEGDQKSEPAAAAAINEIHEEPSVDIDHLLKEVEKLSQPAEEAKPAAALLKGKPEEALPASEPVDQEANEAEEEESPSSKQYYLQDFDDESDLWSEGGSREAFASQPKASLADAWKILAGLLFAIIALSAVVCSGVYFRVSGKNSQEEKKIAAGIADIAMAMTHAKLNNITPNKQNWSDPNFIRNNLAYVLSPSLHTQAQIDSEGQFTRYPYRLRVYTSRNMEQFIVIAQPAPNLMQWLVHKKTIVVDSSSMEMRKITDLKAINRLLANPNPLEGDNGDELYRLIKEGALMSLNSLAGHKNHWGFSPPKALAFIRPGAENYIYNAPRYYPFSENLLSGAIHLYQHPGTGNGLPMIEDEIEGISNFKDIVLYTSEGLQMAMEAQKALNSFAPESKFLIAYVQFNSKGFMASSHLLMHEEQHNIALKGSSLRRSSVSFNHETNAFNQSARIASLDLSGVSSKASKEESFESKDDYAEDPPPHTQEFSPEEEDDAGSEDSKAARSNTEVNDDEPLLSQEEAVADEAGGIDLEHPLYLELNDLYSKHKNRMVGELAKLSEKYPDVPREEFIKYASQAELAPFASLAFDHQRRELNTASDSDSMEEMEKGLRAVLAAQSLPELEREIEKNARIFSPENRGDPDMLANGALDRLAILLLSPESPYSSNPPEEEDRAALIRILEGAKISDPYVSDYFISEFEQML